MSDSENHGGGAVGPYPSDDAALDLASFTAGVVYKIARGEVVKPAPDDPEAIDPIAKLNTLKQAARKLGISDDQVRGLVQDGELQYINTGRGKKRPRMKFTDADLDEFIERRRRKNTPCLSTNRKSHRTITSTSGPVVIGFTALRNAQLEKKPKSLKR
jgi:excisionase family DNA binding protein